jgi:hypothetical protein
MHTAARPPRIFTVFPFLLIRPEFGPNRKATFQILKEQLHRHIYRDNNLIASKIFILSEVIFTACCNFVYFKPFSLIVVF